MEMPARITRKRRNGKTARKTNGTKGHRYQGTPFDFVDEDVIFQARPNWREFITQWPTS
jgi:hypothetical protein